MSGSSRKQEWHAEARRMRAAGSSMAAIAQRFGRHQSSVAWFLNEDGHQAKKNAKVRAFRSSASGAAQRDAECGRQPRTPRKLIDREALAKILAERRGDISREELMRAITP